MKLPSDAVEKTIDIARACLTKKLVGDAYNFAEVIVHLANCCVVGIQCERHGSAIHGQEAEELRAGIEQILRNTADVVDDSTALDVLCAIRTSLNFLLDHTDARDSLAFREATDPD